MTEPRLPHFYDRLIMTFPINGEPDIGERIYLRDNDAGYPQTYIRMTDQSDTQWQHHTLADAIRVALNNSGWGSYRIQEIET